MQQKLLLNPNQEPYSGILPSCMKLCKAHWLAGCVLWQRVLLQHGEPNKGLFPSPSDGRWRLDRGGAVGKLSTSSYSHRRSQHAAHRRRKSAAVAAFHIFRCAANDRNGVPAGPVKGFFLDTEKRCSRWPWQVLNCGFLFCRTQKVLKLDVGAVEVAKKAPNFVIPLSHVCSSLQFYKYFC